MPKRGAPVTQMSNPTRAEHENFHQPEIEEKPQNKSASNTIEQAIKLHHLPPATLHPKHKTSPSSDSPENSSSQSTPLHSTPLLILKLKPLPKYSLTHISPHINKTTITPPQKQRTKANREPTCRQRQQPHSPANCVRSRAAHIPPPVSLRWNSP